MSVKNGTLAGGAGRAGECRPRVGSLTYVSPSVALQRLLVEHLDVMVAHPSLRFRHGLSRGDAPRRDGHGRNGPVTVCNRGDRALRASETVPNCQSTDARIITNIFCTTRKTCSYFGNKRRRPQWSNARSQGWGTSWNACGARSRSRALDACRTSGLCSTISSRTRCAFPEDQNSFGRQYQKFGPCLLDGGPNFLPALGLPLLTHRVPVPKSVHVPAGCPVACARHARE